MLDRMFGLEDLVEVEDDTQEHDRDDDDGLDVPAGGVRHAARH